jgi:hypothetical protein
MRAISLVLFSSLALTLGCSSSEEAATGEENDASAEVSGDTGSADTEIDGAMPSDSSTEDSGMDTETIDSSPVDSSVDAKSDATADSKSDASTDLGTDVATEAASDASSDLGTDAKMEKGQCYLNAQCASGSCAANGPGGICSCAGAAACPATFECGPFASCTHSCSDDSDCVRGLRCNTSTNTCVLKTCSSSSDCLAPLVCRPLSSGGGTQYCLRAQCDTTACPSGSTCKTTSDGKLCVEDALTF